MVEISYDDILKTIGFGRVHYLLIFTAGIIRMLPVNETMGMGMIVVSAKCDFEMNVDRIAITTTAPFFGMIVSAYFCGYLCDIVGRKKVLLITVFGANISSVISVFMPHFWWFVAARFVTGIFLSGPAAIPITYLNEFCTKASSTQIINWMEAFTGVSMVYCPTLGFLLLPSKWSIPLYGQYHFTPWRLQVLLYTLPGLIGALILISLPESPNYLLAVGKQREGYAALNWVCTKSVGRTLKDILRRHSSGSSLKATISAPTGLNMFGFKTFWSETLPLFRKPVVVNFLISCVMMFGLIFIANGMGIWYPSIRGLYRQKINNKITTPEDCTFCETLHLKEYDPFSEKNGGLMCLSVQRESARDSIALGVIYILCYISQGVLLHFIGRRNTMILAFLLNCPCIIILTRSVSRGVYTLLIFCLFLSLPAVTICMLTSGLLNFTPTRLRGKAVCIVFLIGRLGAVIGVYGLLEVFDKFCNIESVPFIVYFIGSTVVLYILPID